MPPKTRINAFYLFTKTMQRKTGDTTSTKHYMESDAENKWNALSAEDRQKWKERAFQLRNSNDGHGFDHWENEWRNTSNPAAKNQRDYYLNRMTEACDDLPMN